MANLDSLTARSLRHYELGRLRMAARIAIVLLPVAAVCLLEPAGREASACCAALLLLASVWLRFRSRAGVESVSSGLLAGAIPLVALLLLRRFDPGCATAGALSICSGFSLVAGIAAGAVVAWRERTRASHSYHWLFTLSIAVLTAALGCARLGIASVVGVALGTLLGHVSARGAIAQ